MTTMLQGPNKDFALHTIGWQAFQDLVATIVEVDVGRVVQRVAKVKDDGRDGFFYGLLDELVVADDERETTIQCKHFETPAGKLTVASLKDELKSVRKLVASGRAHGYILATNASVTESRRTAIVAALREAGVAKPYVFGREWIVDKILEHPKVRALAPRVYGLGDLSWINSETARKQALAILDTMGEGLRCYVTTKAHADAVTALDRHHFVLLLGDPAVGKSSIAASLAVAATDENACDVIFVRHPGEFLKSWDPEVGNRLFWVDDAFGATKLENALMDPWNKVLSSMQAAIQRGNRFILTSRLHIWREARRHLKQGVFPPLSRDQVVVDVAVLSEAETKRILYNHLRFGSQKSEFKTEIRPHLDAVLADGHFGPEIARRLADPAYTTKLQKTLEGLKDFFARPEAFLLETLTNLPDPMRAAIGLIFISGGRLPSPIPANDALRLIEELYGVTLAQVREALQSISGSFVLSIRENDEHCWTYKHPTISDAYARLVGGDQELVMLYVRGAKMSQVLDEAICGGDAKTGIVIPPGLYSRLLDRFANSGISTEAVRQFLLFRSGEAFLKAFVTRHPKFPFRSGGVHLPVASDVSAMLAVKAERYGCLSGEERDRLVSDLTDHVTDFGDVGFLNDDPDFAGFLSVEEREELLSLARDDMSGRFCEMVENEKSSYESSWDPEEWFDEQRARFRAHLTLFPDDEEVATEVKSALRQIDRAVESLRGDDDPEREWDTGRRSWSKPGPGEAGGRSIFDDLV